MKGLLIGIIALSTMNGFADTKIAYPSISACVKDLYANTSHGKESAKEHCLSSEKVNITYSSVSACVQDLYENTSHGTESAKKACLNL